MLPHSEITKLKWSIDWIKHEIEYDKHITVLELSAILEFQTEKLHTLIVPMNGSTLNYLVLVLISMKGTLIQYHLFLSESIS